MHVTGGIGTRNPSNRVVVDSRIRARGHWNNGLNTYPINNHVPNWQTANIVAVLKETIFTYVYIYN
jgi:hypothetical protein